MPRGASANARRKYLHVKDGFNLKDYDLSHIVKDIELLEELVSIYETEYDSVLSSLRSYDNALADHKLTQLQNHLEQAKKARAS